MLVQMLKCITSYLRQPLHVLICDQNTTGIFAWKSPGFRLDPQSLKLAQITVCWGLSNRNCHSPSASGKPWPRLSSVAVCWDTCSEQTALCLSAACHACRLLSKPWLLMLSGSWLLAVEELCLGLELVSLQVHGLIESQSPKNSCWAL